MNNLRKAQDDRETLLNALLEIAEESGNFNPHFIKSEILKKLNISECKFNIIRANLGEKYCPYIGLSMKGGDRFSINVSACWQLHDQFKLQNIHRQNHETENTMLLLTKCILGLTAVMCLISAIQIFTLPPALDRGIKTSNQNNTVIHSPTTCYKCHKPKKH